MALTQSMTVWSYSLILFLFFPPHFMSPCVIHYCIPLWLRNRRFSWCCGATDGEQRQEVRWNYLLKMLSYFRHGCFYLGCDMKCINYIWNKIGFFKSLAQYTIYVPSELLMLWKRKHLRGYKHILPSQNSVTFRRALLWSFPLLFTCHSLSLKYVLNINSGNQGSGHKLCIIISYLKISLHTFLHLSLEGCFLKHSPIKLVVKGAIWWCI